MASTQRLRRSPYRVLGLVGHGQFGRVYCAVHRRTGELVALKSLNRERFSTHKFLRELHFLLSLEHPNIATCQALEHSAMGRQLVLDYCEGGTLRYLIDKAVPLTLAEILAFTQDLLRALDQAHRQGIVHCDIKPENILLSITPGGWQAKISDFGIARFSREASEAEMGHTGSPAYMAPERFYNQHLSASDLYAAGIILYELLMGERPFSGTPAELMVAHLNQRPVMPDSIPSPLAEIIHKALQKLLARRYKTAADMLAAIRAVAQQFPAEMLAVPLSRNPEDPILAPDLAFVTLPHPLSVMGLVQVPLKQANPDISDQNAQFGQVLVTCQQEQIWFYHWSGQGQDGVGQTQGFSLPWSVRQFRATPYGGCLLTDYSLHLLSMQHGLGAIARFDHPVRLAIAPHGRWFAACPVNTQASATQLLLRRLLAPNTPVKASTLVRIHLPLSSDQVVALEALDTCHLLVVTQQNDKTAFQCFTRRGTAVGTLHLGTRVSSLTPTDRPYRFLALEQPCPNAVLVIDFKPFRVSRYRLDIQPRWLLNTNAGYAAISEDGKLRLLSDGGNLIGQVDQLPRPVAVTCRSSTQLLWAVSESTSSRIYTVDLPALGLDIIF